MSDKVAMIRQWAEENRHWNSRCFALCEFSDDTIEQMFRNLPDAAWWARDHWEK